MTVCQPQMNGNHKSERGCGTPQQKFCQFKNKKL